MRRNPHYHCDRRRPSEARESLLCGLPVVKGIAVITDPSEVNKILECLKRNNAPPFYKGALKAS